MVRLASRRRRRRRRRLRCAGLNRPGLTMPWPVWPGQPSTRPSDPAPVPAPSVTDPSGRRCPRALRTPLPIPHRTAGARRTSAVVTVTTPTPLSRSLGRPAGLCPLTQTPGTSHAATGCLLKQQIPHLHRQSPPLRIPSRLVASSRPLFANLPSDDTQTHTLRETKTPALTSPALSNRSIHHYNVIQPKATNPQPHSAAFGLNLALRILRLIWAWTSVIL